MKQGGNRVIFCLLLPIFFLENFAAATQPDQATLSKSNPVKTKTPHSTTVPAQQYHSQLNSTHTASNSFNRLLKVSPKHLPPVEDGIHDPFNDGTRLLQPPLEAFVELPKTQVDIGNGVHWVQALDEGLIKPLWDINNPIAKPTVLNMDIIRFPRGSMPNVLFPHRQHSLWLDCSNCHPAIFIPQKGANQISMAANLLGQKCGVCHGRVAFPFSQCKRCHSQPKVFSESGGVQR